ncbi:MAG: hypothetical protein V4481_04415 [Patescibacteria group bacterium]
MNTATLDRTVIIRNSQTVMMSCRAVERRNQRFHSEARMLHEMILHMLGLKPEQLTMWAMVDDSPRSRSDRFIFIDERTHRVVQVAFVPAIGMTSRLAHLSVPFGDIPADATFYATEVIRWFEMMERAVSQ